MTVDDLIEKILSAPSIYRAPMRSDLFKYLADPIRRDKFISDKEIWTEVFAKDEGLFHVGNVPERCSDLRSALNDLFPRQRRGLVCRLPHARRGGGGYRLEFSERKDSLTEAFWRPHLDRNHEILLVSNQPLFFVNQAENQIFRYFDVNTPNPKARNPLNPHGTLLGELQAQHPDVKQAETLEAVYPYLSFGDVGARDAISNWFYQSNDVKVTPSFSNRMHDDSIRDKSLILLGEAHTNRFIDWIEVGGVGSDSIRDIGWQEPERYVMYHIKKRTPINLFGQVEIFSPTNEEKRVFPMGDEGTRSVGDKTIETYTITNNPKTVVFGVVRRTSNPYNDATITVISSSYSEAVEQIAMALTEEEIFSKISLGLLDAEGHIPPYFEGIFAVQLGSKRIESGALKPHCVRWRETKPIVFNGSASGWISLEG